MFCECEVRYVKKDPNGEGYTVYFAWHGSRRGAFKNHIYEDLMWVRARKCVFLGAGSLGTTEILLRSKEVGLKVSETIGTGMSGNGDILAFGYDSLPKLLPPTNRSDITRTIRSIPWETRLLCQNVPLAHVSTV